MDSVELSYLSELRDYLKLDPSVKDEFLLELSSHMEDRSRELMKAGLPDSEAKLQALKSLGPAKLIARQIYEVYSQGTWKQALGSALPHVLIALLFALRLLPTMAGLITVAALSMATVIYGWCHGKPAWLFPWLGVLLTPAIIVGIMLIYVPSGFMWFAALTYIPLAALVLIMVTKQTLKRDWLFISLMLLPVPLVLGWLLAFTLEAAYFNAEQVYRAGTWIGLSNAILALTVIVFMRVKQRWLKIWVLIAPEILVITIVVLNSGSSLRFWGWLLLSLLALALILGPAFLEKRAK
jgi:hypothetical protein